MYNGNEIKIRSSDVVRNLMDPRNPHSYGLGDISGIIDAKKDQFDTVKSFMEIKKAVLGKGSDNTSLKNYDMIIKDCDKAISQLECIESALSRFDCMALDEEYRKAYSVADFCRQWKDMRENVLTTADIVFDHLNKDIYTKELLESDSACMKAAFDKYVKMDLRLSKDTDLLKYYVNTVSGTPGNMKFQKLQNISCLDRLSHNLSVLLGNQDMVNAAQYASYMNERAMVSDIRQDELYCYGNTVKNLTELSKVAIAILDMENCVMKETVKTNEEIITLSADGCVTYKGTPECAAALQQKLGGHLDGDTWQKQGIDVDAVRAAVFNYHLEPSIAHTEQER